MTQKQVRMGHNYFLNFVVNYLVHPRGLVLASFRCNPLNGCDYLESGVFAAPAAEEEGEA